MERENDEETDERRESGIASRPNLKTKSGITESQLVKFQELHKRRLKIKAKSKRDKGDGKIRHYENDVEAHECTEPNKLAPDPPTIVPNSDGKRVNICCEEGSKTAGNSRTSKRQKLYWGLDVKERWERKSNM